MSSVIELEGLRTQILDTRSQLPGIDDPAHAAGYPGIIRVLRDAHGRAATALRSVQDDGQSLTMPVVSDGAWEARPEARSWAPGRACTGRSGNWSAAMSSSPAR